MRGEEFDGLGLGALGQQDRHLGFLRGLGEQGGESFSGRAPVSDDDPRWVQIVMEGQTLTEELGGEDDPIGVILPSQTCGKANGHSGFDDADRVVAVPQNL